MTKNELTRLLGIDALMRRNAKSKVFTTMLDILCDFLIITKEASDGLGVQYPANEKNSLVTVSHHAESQPTIPKSSTVRPMTSAGPSLRPIGNYYNGGLASNNFMNNFSAGSNADLMTHEQVFTQEQKGSASTEYIYGISTAAASKPQINFTRGEPSINSLENSYHQSGKYTLLN
jgi:hypothetical protein